MFERYTERARRVIFFARYEASQFGSTTIETEHLLLGLLRENRNIFRDLSEAAAADAMLGEIQNRLEKREKVSTSIDLPISAECKRILGYAAEDAERLNHRHLGTEHLLAGMLRESGSTAARILQQFGVEREKVLQRLKEGGVRPEEFESTRGMPPSEVPPANREAVRALVDKLPDESLGWAKVMLERLQTAPFGRGTFPPAGEARAMTAGLGSIQRDAEGKAKQGRSTTSRNEGDTLVIETQQLHQGHQVTLTERLRLSEDGKTLSYSQTIVGPKVEQQHKHSIEFDVS